MGRHSLQYSVLAIGTIVFSLLLYFLVEAEKGNTKIIGAVADYNQITVEQANIYSSPDNNSTILGAVTANTKVLTTSETKFYFRVIMVDGQGTIKDGYILKRQLKRLE